MAKHGRHAGLDAIKADDHSKKAYSETPHKVKPHAAHGGMTEILRDHEESMDLGCEPTEVSKIGTGEK